MRPLPPLMILGFLACWGGGSGRISTLAPTQVIGALEDGSLARLCQEIDGWAQRQYGNAEFKRQQCEIEAAMTIRHTRSGPAQSFAPECRAHARDCFDAFGQASNLVIRCQRGPAPCPATVDELERCLTDQAYNLYGLFLTTPMCDDICRPFDAGSLESPSCNRFRAACPGYAFTERPRFPLLEQGVPDNCVPVR